MNQSRVPKKRRIDPLYASVDVLVAKLGWSEGEARWWADTRKRLLLNDITFVPPTYDRGRTGPIAVHPKRKGQARAAATSAD